jgi:quercetin dioxygenase-like cupin family protein
MDVLARRPEVAIAQASDSKVLRAYGDEMTVLLGGEQTGGQLAVLCTLVAPGGGPPPHYHENEDEWFFVLEGAFEFLTGEDWRPVAMNGVVFAPRLSVHAYRNVGNTVGRLLIQTSPAGFEQFFEESAAEFARSDRPDPDRLIAIGLAYGIHFV